MSDDYELDLTQAEYRCPECKSPHGLWENIDVHGWRTITVTPDDDQNPNIESFMGSGDWGWEEQDVYPTGSGGCGECTWTGRIPGDLEFYATKRIGWDGKPIRKPMPGQLDLMST